MSHPAAFEQTPGGTRAGGDGHPVFPRARVVVGVLLLAGVLPQLICQTAQVLLGNAPMVQEALHEGLELVGTCIALTVAMLLLLRLRYEESAPHLLWVGAALVAMGLVDAVDALAPFGVPWSWLRHGATLTGGLVFSLVWLPPPAVITRRPWRFVLVVAGLALAEGLSLLWKDAGWMPAPWIPTGDYTAPVTAANALGGMGFLAASAFFLKRYLHRPTAEDLIFASHTMLFGTSSLLFGLSHLWAADWWLWHGFRLLGFTILLIAAYDMVSTLYRKISLHAHALETRTAELQRIEWLLTRGVKPEGLEEPPPYAPAYGDLTKLNTERLILDSVGEPVLTGIVNDYLDLLGTSAAVYEKNGDYALGLFSSGWCRFLDQASRRLCGFADNREALACGHWHCHESCWTQAAKQSIQTGQPVDIECAGALHLYALPIQTGDEIIGALNFGYGDPPRDPAKLQELAAKFGVDVDELSRQAEAYESRPPFMIQLAKSRLATSAKLIAEIVERRRAEKALQNLTAKLDQRVQERTLKLETAVKELEAFAYSISHDLRAPLRAIDGFGRKLDMNFADRLGDEGRRLLQVIRGNARRMGDLIDNLLAFSRMGRREILSASVDMDGLVRSIAEELCAAEPSRRIEIEIAPLPAATGDVAMLRQVWFNLLANAVKFTRPRPVAKIEVGARHEGPDVLYWIKDNGVGFDMQYADKLFGVFQRLHSMDEFEGTGVGLALSQRIIQRHNGRIWADGRLNEGARFSFTLPTGPTDDIERSAS